MNTSLILLLVVVLNLGISYWNARVCGQVWEDAKALGGWLRVLVWCGAIQSAIGFSSVLMILLGGIAYAFGYLPQNLIKGMFSLWYVLVIVPALMSGWIITIHSWISLARDRSLLNMGTTAWNTYASIHNTIDAFQGIGGAFDGIGKMFDDVDSDSAPLALVILAVVLVLASVLGGIFLTAAIIKANKGTLPLPELQRA